MKKIKLITNAVFVILLILMNMNYAIAADENTKYDITVSVQNVITVDQPVPADENIFDITVSFRNIERFQNVKVFVNFNTDLIEFITCTNDPVAVYSYGCRPTEDGVVFSASLNDEFADRNESYSVVCQGFLCAKAVGENNMTVNVEAVDANGNSVDLSVEFSAPYEKIVDRSEIDHIVVDESYIRNSVAHFECGVKTDDILSKVKSKNAVIANVHGQILLSDDIVTNASRIVTFYNGYEADSILICIPYDVDCDGHVTAADARLALRKSAGIENIDGVMSMAADVDGSSKITAADARLILRKAAGL